MIGKTISKFWRHEALLPAITLLFLLIVSAASVLEGWQLGMALRSALRFLFWISRGIVVLSALLGLGVMIANFLGWRSPESPPLRQFALYFVTGWAFISLCGILALATGSYTEMIWIPLFISGAVAAAFVAARWLQQTVKTGIRIPSIPDLPLLLVALLVMTLITGAIWMASIPPDTKDELAYHILLPQQWALSGSWDQAPGNPLLLFPANTEILFGWASATGGEGSPRFLALCAALLCLGLLVEAQKSALSRFVTLAFIVLTPMMILAMSVAYVEYFLSLLILLGWRMGFDRSKASVGPTGLAWGMALGIKYTAIPLIGFLLLEALWKLGSERRKEQKVLLASFLGASLLLAAPWYLRNFELRGDPLYPFGALKTAPESPAAGEAAVMTEFSPIPRAWRFSPWLYHATENPLVDEHLHPLWAILIPGVVFFGWKRRDLPWFSIAGMSLFFMLFRPACRVMLPAMLPACWWLGALIDRVSESSWSRLFWSLPLSLLAFLSLPFILGQWIVVDRGASIRYLSGEISAEKYLEDSGILTPTISYLANQTPRDTHVWVWGEDRALYLRRWVWTDLSSCAPQAFLLAEKGEKQLEKATARWRIDYILVSREQIAEDFSSFNLHGREERNESSRTAQAWLETHAREIGRDQRFRLFRLHPESGSDQ